MWGLSWWFRGIRGILPGTVLGTGVFVKVGEFRESLKPPTRENTLVGGFIFASDVLGKRFGDRVPLLGRLINVRRESIIAL